MSEQYKYDELEDKLYVKRTVDVSSVIEANKRAFDVDNKTYHKQSEVFNREATVPLIVIEAYCKQKGMKWEEFWSDEKHMLTFLRDPDNKAWRTSPRKI